jgi:cytidylate kinase
MPTPAKTIAISRQRGSGGSRIARAVADRLGYRYIDRELLRLAAEYLRSANTPEAAPPNSWWARLGQAFAGGAPDSGYAPPSSDAVYEGELFDIEQRVLLDIAGEHDAVIVGRGAAQSLRGRSGLVSVFLHAAEAHRVARVKHVYQLADDAAARRSIERSDADRARFIRSLVDADWTDARLYDLAIDTASLDVDAAADLIVRAAQSRAQAMPTP